VLTDLKDSSVLEARRTMNKFMITSFLLYSVGVGSLVIGQTDAGAPAAEPKEAKSVGTTSEVSKDQSERFSFAGNTYLVVSFVPNSSNLTKTYQQQLKNTLDLARTDGTQLNRVIVAAWSDSDLPISSDITLPDAAIKLADERARAIETVLKELGVARVDTHSMAEHANWLERLFNTTDAQIKDTFQNKDTAKSASSLLTEQLISQGGPQKALVLIFRETPSLAH